jgi:hypothetical protein
MILLWSTLYVIYTCLFGVRLRSWDYITVGRCYNTHNIALPQAKHPYVDNIYLSITCLYVFLTLGIAFSAALDDQFWSAYMVLFVAAMQYPLHLYSIFTLRASNESLLASGTTEQQWGFGQIVAVILLGTNLVVLVNGLQGLYITSLSCVQMSDHVV